MILLFLHFESVVEVVLKAKVWGKWLNWIFRNDTFKSRWINLTSEASIRSSFGKQRLMILKSLTTIYTPLLDFSKVCLYITCISLICWHAIVEVRRQCTGRFGWVDSRAHRVSSLVCSLRGDGDWTSHSCWCKGLHCFGFCEFGLNWES